ncbi:MAG: hypothetical protein QGH20_02270 [Candidatus Latescibacteria bacterium]|jgi:hypothetical protein|nr:hypothetical protein [Candidatus Latescibacterota bacterium]
MKSKVVVGVAISLCFAACGALLEPGGDGKVDLEYETVLDGHVEWLRQVVASKRAPDDLALRYDIEEYACLLGKLERVRLNLGDGTADSAVQCRAIGFGHKACGGPRTYLVYSIVAADSIGLAAAVSVYNSVERDLNTKYGPGSDCEEEMPPQLSLAEWRCASGGRRTFDRFRDAAE